MKGVPSNGVRRSPQEWLTTENAILTRLFNEGAQLPAMVAALPRRTDSQIRRHLHYLGLKRETKLLVRTSWVWESMKAAIAERGPMTAAELEERTNSAHGAVIRMIKRFHGDGLYISAWRPTLRKPAAVWALGSAPDADKRAVLTRRYVKKSKVNPFAAAIGAIEAPKSAPGRVYIHLTDDERAAA